jgi:hypothetical protein
MTLHLRKTVDGTQTKCTNATLKHHSLRGGTTKQSLTNKWKHSNKMHQFENILYLLLKESDYAKIIPVSQSY